MVLLAGALQVESVIIFISVYYFRWHQIQREIQTERCTLRAQAQKEMIIFQQDAKMKLFTLKADKQ